MTYPTPDELRAKNLPRLAANDIFGSGDGDLPEADRKALDEYLRIFTMPVEGKCIRCERTLGGLLGGFTWGIAHGEGTCGECGWPARAYHEPKEGPVESFRLILPYHPDELVEKGK